MNHQVSTIVGRNQRGQVFAPGSVKWAEPCDMRPADLRLAGDRIGEYHLANGNVVWITWIPSDARMTDILVWDAGDTLIRIDGVARVNAAYRSEQVLVDLEETA